MFSRGVLLLFMVACTVLPGHLPARPALPEAAKAQLLGWYDAGDAASLTLVDGTVAGWKDKSGQGRDFVQDAAGQRPQRVTDQGCQVIQQGQMVAKGAALTLDAMTVYAVVKVAPSYSPIIAFRTDGKTEFCAAGWTIGARPTLFTTNGSTAGTMEIEDNAWHLLTFVRDGAARAFYVDGVQVGTPAAKAGTSELTDFLLFAYSTAASYSGRLAELLIYRAAHAPEQMGPVQDYLLAKWAPLFPPAKSDLVTFVGNSLTTGMFCGNGKTWTAQAAAKVPGLARWYNVSKGGITTQGLAALAPVTIDGLLARGTGRTVLVVWEGTNDLAVNKATAEVAHEAIKGFCQARKKAGWEKIVVLTVLPRQTGNDFETRRTALNHLLRQHYAEYADALVDVAASPEIGVAGCEANREYFPDGVHLTAKGNGIVAALVAPKLATVLAAKTR
jgi:lysophospholipase L1-like esterase